MQHLRERASVAPTTTCKGGRSLRVVSHRGAFAGSMPGSAPAMLSLQAAGVCRFAPSRPRTNKSCAHEYPRSQIGTHTKTLSTRTYAHAPRTHTRVTCYLSLSHCLLRKHSFDLDVSKAADGRYVIGHPVDLERLLAANEAITVCSACLLQASGAHCGEARSAWE